jgi:hypothetical protein
MRAAAEQCAFLLEQYGWCLAGLEDRHRALEPTPGAKTAGWLVGHLVVTGDFGRRLCTLKPLAPKEWRPLFSPGTQPSRDAAIYPPMKAMVDAFRSIYEGLVADAPAAPAEALAAPNPFEPARAGFPTAGSFAAYLLTGHLGFHLGQLSIWRAAAADTDPALRRSA